MYTRVNGQTVLKTQEVYKTQKGPVVAEEIEVLVDFGAREKVVAIMVDYAAKKDLKRELEPIWDMSKICLVYNWYKKKIRGVS